MTNLFISGIVSRSSRVKKIVAELKDINITTLSNDEWNMEAISSNDYYKSTCDHILYIITPATSNSYIIADMIDSLNKYKEKTIYCFDIADYDKYGSLISTTMEMNSMKYVSNYIKENGGKVLLSVSHVSKYILQL